MIIKKCIRKVNREDQRYIHDIYTYLVMAVVEQNQFKTIWWAASKNYSLARSTYLNVEAIAEAQARFCREEWESNGFDIYRQWFKYMPKGIIPGI